MRSEAQIRASRLNSAKSRGPRRKTIAPQPGLSARSVVLCNERLALAYKRIAKDLDAVQQTEARMQRSLDRALTAFHRLRKFRPPDAQPIEPPATDVTTTGRDPASYFMVESEPKPTTAESPQTSPLQALAAQPPKSATAPEPKRKPKRCLTRNRYIRRRESKPRSLQVEFMRCHNCAPTFIP